MSLKTSNAYGDITISDEAISVVAGFTVLECYGVVDLVNSKASDTFPEVFKKVPLNRGVKIVTNGNRITIELYVILKYGVAINATAESIRNTVKYNVEKFTGMIVETVNVKVVGVRV
ncbi:MAG: Asp23/Gls24 family envelope stress response protein [Christensenellaceae bacterium]|jgi:uncharacterized alkaline shock family protein YloU|nr:Asp23/Gls24 family envelope stress response protein [Christensenellaceae bacterium]